MLTEQTARDGIQKRTMRNGLLPSRLAARSNAKITIARIQNRGEKKSLDEFACNCCQSGCFCATHSSKNGPRTRYKFGEDYCRKPAEDALSVIHNRPRTAGLYASRYGTE